jgi:hypothetical protein
MKVLNSDRVIFNFFSILLFINVPQNSIPVFKRGSRGRDCMVVGFTTTYAITTDVVSSNLDQGKVYNIM